MKSYTIVGHSSPHETLTYHGTFEPVPGQPDIVTAMAAEFADGDVEALIGWLGGDAPLAEIAATDDEIELRNDGAVYHIHDQKETEI